MLSLIGVRAAATSLGAALLAMLAAWPAAAAPLRCAEPAAPFRVAQQQAVAGFQVRALDAPGSAKLPRLVFLDGRCHPVSLTVFGRPDPETQGSDPPPHLLRFKVLSVAGMPDPLLLAVMASPGGSDTEFDTQVFAPEDGRFRALLPRAAISLLEGGIYLGDLGAGIGPGFALWTMAWAPGEVHADPHRYTLRRWRWTGQGFEALPTETTQQRYGDPAAALHELGVAYRDMTQDFPDFAKYR
jgi:hypothetical protein